VWFSATPSIGVNAVYAGSTDNGASFGAPVALTLRPSMGETHPSVAVSPQNSAHVIWYEADAGGVDQIVHRVLQPPSGSVSTGSAAPAWDETEVISSFNVVH